MRTRDIETGTIRNGEKEVLRLHDDGYRIKFSWVSGAPTNVEDWSEMHSWAEYKQCDFPGIGYLIADLIMTPNVGDEGRTPQG